MNKKYDYLIVGAGLFGCVCAEQLRRNGFKVLIVEKMNHIGGTCYTENHDGINVHKYGAHIFRTNNKMVFDYLKQFAEFNGFINSPIAIHNGHAYNLPFNMNTFSKVWDITTPSEAREIIEREIKEFGVEEPKNLEEQAIALAGKTIYEMFIKEYTEKQWGKPCKVLPANIIRRIPLRYTYDNNYYNSKYQGIPIGGYTQIFEKMISGCDLVLSTDFNKEREKYFRIANTIIYTGPIDEFFDYKFGELEYRGLLFIEKEFDVDNYQGNAVLNYSDKDFAYTRSIEHKHFDWVNSNKTIVSYEYPIYWKKGNYPFYPINDEKNTILFKKYMNESQKVTNVVFGGRLGNYQYFDMQDTIIAAIDLCKKIIGDK